MKKKIINFILVFLVLVFAVSSVSADEISKADRGESPNLIFLDKNDYKMDVALFKEESVDCAFPFVYICVSIFNPERKPIGWYWAKFSVEKEEGKLVFIGDFSKDFTSSSTRKAMEDIRLGRTCHIEGIEDGIILMMPGGRCYAFNYGIQTNQFLIELPHIDGALIPELVIQDFFY